MWMDRSNPGLFAADSVPPTGITTRRHGVRNNVHVNLSKADVYRQARLVWSRGTMIARSEPEIRRRYRLVISIVLLEEGVDRSDSLLMYVLERNYKTLSRLDVPWNLYIGLSISTSRFLLNTFEVDLIACKYLEHYTLVITSKC